MMPPPADDFSPAPESDRHPAINQPVPVADPPSRHQHVSAAGQSNQAQMSPRIGRADFRLDLLEGSFNGAAPRPLRPPPFVRPRGGCQGIELLIGPRLAINFAGASKLPAGGHFLRPRGGLGQIERTEWLAIGPFDFISALGRSVAQCGRN